MITNTQMSQSSENGQISFLVSGGVSEGAKFVLPDGSEQTVGDGIDNDIVIFEPSTDSWQIKVAHTQGNVTLEVTDGVVFRGDESLAQAETYTVTSQDNFSIGDTHFQIFFGAIYVDPPVTTIDNDVDLARGQLAAGVVKKKPTGRIGIRHLLFGLSVFCIALGTLSAIYAVTGSVIMVNANPGLDTSAFDEKIEMAGLGSVQKTLSNTDQTYLLTGMVDTRDQRNKILEIADETATSVELDLQVNDELIESVEDIYRVNGINANVEVMGIGQVKILTETGDTARLLEVEATARKDMPAVQSFEVVNTLPAAVTKPAPTVKKDPDKRVTLISAGSSAYIMTQDQSRYFVGGLLPSGHLILSIREGEVIVTKDGVRDTLKY